MKYIKEWFTARYDPRTEQIEGCTPFTFTWYHENRHKQQMFNKDISNADFLSGVSTLVGKAILLFSFLKGFSDPILFMEGAKIALYFMIPSLVFNFVLEMDANVYAWKKKK